LELDTESTTIHDQLPEGTTFVLTGDTAGTYYVIVSVSEVGLMTERHVLANGQHVKQGRRFFPWTSGAVLVLPN
jgi:hypothetical protein